MLAFMPQIWTSDNMDAVSRLFIQYGRSFVFPPVTMGAHVSVVPNHQVGRSTPLKPRDLAAGGLYEGSHTYGDASRVYYLRRVD